MKILIPIDGSARANAAVEYVVASAANQKIAPEICLINVQWKLAAGNVKLFIGQETMNDYYREQGAAALAAARAILDGAGLAYSVHISVGSPAEAVLQYADAHQIDQIVLSGKTDASLAQFLLGSVAAEVLKMARVPVLFVK